MINKFILGFIGSAIILAFTAWLAGYNFDYRSVDVAFGFIFGVLLSFIGGMVADLSEL